MKKTTGNNRIKNRRGFTLAETLVAVLILLMVTVIVMTGIPSAKNAYDKVVLSSNADVLLSTAITTLRNELGTAKRIQVLEGGKGIVYYNGTRESLSKIELDTTEIKAAMIQRYVADGDVGMNTDPVRLVSKTASTADLYVTYTSVDYKDGIVTFTGLEVRRESGGSLAERDKFSVRILSGQ